MTIPQTLVELLSRLRAREEAVTEELHDVREDIKAVERTIGLLRQGSRNTETPESLTRYKPEEFTGMSQLGAIVALAKRNDGVVTVKEARRMLLETGLTKSKQASQIATGTIIRSKRFEWVTSGTYRLKKNISSDNGHNGERPSLITVG